MRSKTTSGVSYGNRKDANYSILCPKKQKRKNGGRRRVPRRGPGVAELEKIRLDQEQQHITTAAPLSLPLPPPSEKSPTNTKRTGPVYPLSSYLTTGSFPNVFQRKHDSSLHYLPTMNLPNKGSEGFYQFIETPSNQTSCLDNEEKILAAKRPWHFISETTKRSVGPSPTITISRDGKQIKSLNLKSNNHIQDSGTTVRNPITIDSLSPTTQQVQYEQRDQYDHEIIMPRRSGANLSLKRKPFYSFLPSNEHIIRDQDRSFSLRSERYDTVTDHDSGIDLRLKL